MILWFPSKCFCYSKLQQVCFLPARGCKQQEFTAAAQGWQLLLLHLLSHLTLTKPLPAPVLCLLCGKRPTSHSWGFARLPGAWWEQQLSGMASQMRWGCALVLPVGHLEGPIASHQLLTLCTVRSRGWQQSSLGSCWRYSPGSVLCSKLFFCNSFVIKEIISS